MKRYRILLATSTSWLSFSRMPRLLDMADCTVDVLCPSKALVAQRRFIDERFLVDGNVEAIANKLLSHLNAEPSRYDWIIIGDDELFAAVAAHGDESIDRWFPSQRDEESIKFFTSKITFMQRCRENGFSIAPYRLCDSLEQAQSAAAEFRFPVVAKTAFSVGGSGVTRIDSAEQLIDHIATIHESFAIQKFSAGRQIVSEVLFDRGSPRCWMASELINCWPKTLSSSTARKLIDVPNMREMLESIGALTKFHGFASIDSILPDDGSPQMLCEMNPRTTTGYHFDPRVRREFARSITEMLEAKSFSHYTPLPATGRNEALFPEAFYYLSSDLRELSRWKFALNSLQRVPIDDPLYLLQMAKDYRHFLKGKMQKASHAKTG
jgi:predicted ATP-grasp superfamily ATP-dependent carboligase